MGNKPVTLGVNTDRFEYESGSVLSGTAYLQVVRKHVKASSLQLRLVGEEVTVVHRSETTHSGARHGERQREDIYESDSSRFWDVNVPLKHFPSGVVEAGRYEFPFQVPLPPHLPGSMNCQRGESHCSIQYTLSIHLAGVPLGSAIMPNFDTSSPPRNLTMLPRSEIIPAGNDFTIPEEVFSINTCCFSKGTMKLGAHLDRTMISPNDTLEIEFTAQNDSTVAINSVQAMIQETVEWTAKGQYSESVTERVVRSKVDSDRFPELQRYASLPSDRYFGQQFYSATAHQQSQKRYMTLQIPKKIRFTHGTGQLVTVRHSLTLALNTPHGCCTTRPEHTILLHVQPQSHVAATSVSYNNNSNNNNIGAQLPEPSAPSPHPPATAEPMMLPEDWSGTAITAEVVSVDENIMAHVFVLGPANKIPPPSAPSLT
eukprot:scaffold85141_cov51-Attheya_sp.AAC.6